MSNENRKMKAKDVPIFGETETAGKEGIGADECGFHLEMKIFQHLFLLWRQ